MKKLLLSGCVLFCIGLMAFAGDAAAFVDLGLSSDGRTYAFGEYGKTDKTFQGYAEIYTVDIEKNDFVEGEVFKTNPSAATTSKSGKAVFDELFDKAAWKLKKYDFKPAPSDNLLYLRDDRKSGDSEIVFKDFEGSTVEQSVFYHIQLAKTRKCHKQECRGVTRHQTQEGHRLPHRPNLLGQKRQEPCFCRGENSFRCERVFNPLYGRDNPFVKTKITMCH